MTNKEAAAELRSAASALEHGRYSTAIRKVRQVFIAICSDDARRSIAHPAQHPDTDEHRSGCVHCQYVYDKALP